MKRNLNMSKKFIAKLLMVTAPLALTPMFDTCADTSKGDKTAAAAPARKSENAVVAKVNGKVVQLKDLLKEKKMLLQQTPQLKEIPETQLMSMLRENEINSVLMLDQAKKMKLDDDPDVRQACAQAEKQIVINAYVMKKLDSSINDSVVKEAHEKIVREFKPETEIHASHILIKDQAQAKEIISDLQNPKHKSKKERFAQLAKEKSIDPSTSNRGGDLGFFLPSMMTSEVSAVASNLKPGEFNSVPIKTTIDGHEFYSIIMVHEFRPSTPPTLEQARGQIFNKLAEKILRETIDNLRQGSKIEYFNENGQPEKPESIEEMKKKIRAKN